jgi:hypothetical protein
MILHSWLVVKTAGSEWEQVGLAATIKRLVQRIHLPQSVVSNAISFDQKRSCR